MSDEFYLIMGMAVVTFLIRYPLFAVAGQFEFPDVVRRALKYVPPTVLMAIIIPSILMPDGKEMQIHLNNSYLTCGVLAACVAWKTKNLLLTIVIGMVAFFAWRMFQI